MGHRTPRVRTEVVEILRLPEHADSRAPMELTDVTGDDLVELTDARGNSDVCVCCGLLDGLAAESLVRYVSPSDRSVMMHR